MKKKLLLDSLIIILFTICIASILSNANAAGGTSTNEGSSASVIVTKSNSRSTDINTTSGLKGDANGDNQVELGDATSITSYVAMQELNYNKPTDEILKIADIDGDKMITVDDAQYVLQYYAMNAAQLNPTWDEAIIASRLVLNRDKSPTKLKKPEYKENNEVGSAGILGKAQVGVKQYDIYTQLSPASWSNTKYWNGTIASDGAGVTTLATVISGYGWDVTPATIAKDVQRGEWNILEEELEKYEIKSYMEQGVNKEKIIANLKEGNAVIIDAKGTIGEKNYTGHYVALLAINDDGQILLADPASKNNTGWIDEDKIFSAEVLAAIYLEN